MLRDVESLKEYIDREHGGSQVACAEEMVASKDFKLTNHFVGTNNMV